MTDTSVLIAGAGIGGLTTALTLHARGIDSIVVDRAGDLCPLGVGINLLPHAVRELIELGLGDRLAAMAAEPTSIAFYDADDQLALREPRGLAGGYRWPQYSVHRGDLQMLLLDAVRERLGADAVRTGHGLLGFDDAGDAVTAHTVAGDLTADHLVGADGIRSVVRSQLHPADDPLLWSGVQMWRGAAQTDQLLDGRTMVIASGPGGDRELVVYPIGGGRVNWVLQVHESSSKPVRDTADWNAAVGPDEAVAQLDSWSPGWFDIPGLITSSASVLRYPMVDRDPLTWWGRGRVTLLGDAAHPMYPVGANGGSQAILDARVLADELSRDRDHGLRRYEENRRPATADVIAANRAMLGTTARNSDELRTVTARYRRDTDADRISA